MSTQEVRNLLTLRTDGTQFDVIGFDLSNHQLVLALFPLWCFFSIGKSWRELEGSTMHCLNRAHDFMVVGAGIVGLTVARELLSRGYRSIAILDKEHKLGAHSSGRNSGVLHAGIYYATDSFLKLELCSRGSMLMQKFARSKRILCIKTGNVVVASSSSQSPSLEALFHRAKANGLDVERIDLKQLRNLEPEAHSTEWAVYSPQIAVIDPGMVLLSLESDPANAGIDIVKGAAVRCVRGDSSLTTKGSLKFGHVVNCAGFCADRVAHWVAVALDYSILPFKGIYQKLARDAARYHGSIYPAPDLTFPFLGVHITRDVKGQVHAVPPLFRPLAVRTMGSSRFFPGEKAPACSMTLAACLFGIREASDK